MTAATTVTPAISASNFKTVEIEGCTISGCPTQFPSLFVETDGLVSDDSTTRTVRYNATTTSIKRAADGSLRVIPSKQDYLLQVPTQRPGAVGLMLVGWGGNNGSTLTASLAAHKQSVTWKSRRGVETPNFYGSLVMASTVALGFDEATGKELSAPIYQLAPFADPTNLVIGGWDISSLDIAASCDRAQVLEPTLIDRLAPTLKTLKPLPSIYDPSFIASNQSDRADNLIVGTKREKLEKLRQDIKYHTNLNFVYFSTTFIF